MKLCSDSLLSLSLSLAVPSLSLSLSHSLYPLSRSCYWFSNGCTIGCDKCDGSQNHVGHGDQEFLYRGMSIPTMRRLNLTIDDPWTPPPGTHAGAQIRGLAAHAPCGRLPLLHALTSPLFETAPSPV